MAKNHMHKKLTYKKILPSKFGAYEIHQKLGKITDLQ